MTKLRSSKPRDIDIATIQQELLNHMYQYESHIGAGGFGFVYLVESCRYHQQFVAKRIPLDKVGPLDDARLCSEVKVLLNLSHPNVVNMYETWTTESDLWIILEYCPNGSLKDHIAKSGPLMGKELYRVLRETVDAVLFCHSKGFAHRDIKPANLLIDINGKVKLADFGLSACRDDENARVRVGSPMYMSPETIFGGKFDGFKCDIWALGVTFYELALGRSPWTGKRNEDVKEQIRVGIWTVSTQCEGLLAELIKKMACANQNERINIMGVRNSTYFKKYETMALTKAGPVRIAIGSGRIQCHSHVKFNSGENGETIQHTPQPMPRTMLKCANFHGGAIVMARRRSLTHVFPQTFIQAEHTSPTASEAPTTCSCTPGFSPHRIAAIVRAQE